MLLRFPIDFEGRAYNTLTLPCERVIIISELVCAILSPFLVVFFTFRAI